MLADRVRETSTTTGTGTFALAGAVQTFRTFASVFAVGATCYYAAVNRDVVGQWEIGVGTVGAGNTLQRTTILASSNADAAVNFSAGVKDIAVTYPASRALYRDASNDVGVTGGAARDLKVTRNLLAGGAVFGVDPGGAEPFRVGTNGRLKGILTVEGSLVADTVFIGSVLSIGGHGVLAGRRAGWTLPTGTLYRGALTDASTQQEFNRALMALINDLHSGGGWHALLTTTAA